MKILILVLLLVATPAWATSIKLTWSEHSTNEAGFNIERKAGTEAWLPLATIDASAVSYTDNGITIGTKYCYRVQMINSEGVSEWSNEACVTSVKIFTVSSDQPTAGLPNGPPPSDLVATVSP